MSNESAKPEIPQFPELTFEEERHLYRLDGLEVPSVTTLMKPLSSDFYSTVDPEVLNRAAKRGTAIHNAVENYAKFGIEDIPPMYAGYFEGFPGTGGTAARPLGRFWQPKRRSTTKSCGMQARSICCASSTAG